MDFNKNQSKPESIASFLNLQVEEQSHICDAIVKVGNWEKRFHRCVLIKSPFFDCLFKHEYKESLTGKIEVKVGSPVAVEMAIMFLYEKEPKLTLDNIENMMTLAEYFLIPNLKSACIAWLKAVEVTHENCLTILRVSSLIDFKISACMKFVEGHLESILENNHFAEIDSDSVKYLFTEKRLSYISADERLKFLLRWTQADPIRRFAKAEELVELLDFRDINQELLKEIANNPLCRKITEKIGVDVTTADKNNRHEVLIMKSKRYRFLGLDLTRNNWFKLETTTSDNQTLYSDCDILGIQNTQSNVYVIGKYKNYINRKQEIVFFDLETSSFRTFPVVERESSALTLNNFDKISMNSDVFVITTTEIVLRNKETDEFPIQYQFFYPNDIFHSLVYIGRASNDRIETNMLFTFLKGKVHKICLNNVSCVAFIMISYMCDVMRIMIYDLNDCKMEIFDNELNKLIEYDDKLCSAENDFVIFNYRRCIYIQRLQGSALGTKYQTKIIEFKVTCLGHSSIKMYFFKDRWYRYFKRSYQENYQFEWTNHAEILSAERQEDVVWTPLPLPKKASKCHEDTLKKLYHVRLPERKLRCYIKCPHCDQLNMAKHKSFRKYSTSDSDKDSSLSDDDWDSSEDKYYSNYCYDVIDYTDYE